MQLISFFEVACTSLPSVSTRNSEDVLSRAAELLYRAPLSYLKASFSDIYQFFHCLTTVGSLASIVIIIISRALFPSCSTRPLQEDDIFSARRYLGRESALGDAKAENVEKVGTFVAAIRLMKYSGPFYFLSPLHPHGIISAIIRTLLAQGSGERTDIPSERARYVG